MSQETDSLADERTWQQPAPGPKDKHPIERPTLRESSGHKSHETDADPLANAKRTDSSDTVSPIPEIASTAAHPDSDPRQTVAQAPSSEMEVMRPPVLEAGKVVFEKYRLIEKIGEGGMGEVWRVWHVNLEAERALKLIKSEFAYNDKGWKRFQREARLMAKINHPNAVSVFDFRRTQTVGYIEMEFIAGRSLTEILKERRDQPMPLEWTVQVLEQICAVLHEAHGHVDETTGKFKPIIHRDLKPSNLMVVERKGDTGPPRLKVLDFGIAKIVEDDGSPELTGAGDLVGTPAYMSPEQIRGGFDRDAGPQEIDGRSDLYSTGVVLYHLLTGALPFRGGKMALLSAHLNNSPMPMKEANPNAEVPAEVERVVLRCLEKDPTRRPQSARELYEQFRKAAGIGKTEVSPRPFGTHRSRTMAVVAAAVVLLASIGLAATVYFRGSRVASLNPSTTKNNKVGTVESEGTRIAPAVGSQTSGLWEPKGYVASDPTDIVPDHPGFPVHLRRLDDDVLFVFLRDRVYIPEEYEPESENNLVGAQGWPSVIIRKHDKARFILIEGAIYRRGDPRAGVPGLDSQNKSITPHHVRVRSFYIQETEVTNGEFESYDKDHPDDPGQTKWRNWLTRFQVDHPDATNYPAACVDFRVARKYARSVGGLLPTEAQWEWAAKSRHDEFLFAWGADFAPQAAGPRGRLDDPNGTEFGPAPVGKYEQDQTKQHVYDMVGNLRELCADAYIPYTEMRLAENSRRNPLVDERRLVDLALPDVKLVVRGGSFKTSEDRAMAFYRWREPPDEIPDDVGFRIVIECPVEPEPEQ